MATIDFGRAVTLAQAAALITAVPQNRFFLQGEPGIGKSSLLEAIGKKLPGHQIGYIDCGNMDLGDTAMPVIDHERHVTSYYPNSRFGLHTGKPVIIMLDEFTKAPAPVQNMLHPLLEVANPRLGDVPLPEGSIVFLTGNLSTDGVGDSLKAHTRNRIGVLNIRKPDADEWLQWAIGSERIDPIVMAWVKQYPHALASYQDGDQKENPYIYNPKVVQRAYVSPRSLEKASHILRVRSQLDHESLIAGLTGHIGEAASRDMMAFVSYQDQLPAWEAIIKDPKTAKVPESPGACAVLVFGAITKVTKDTMEPFMKYMERFEMEWQAAFAINISKSESKMAIAFGSKSFADWVQRNEDLL